MAPAASPPSGPSRPGTRSPARCTCRCGTAPSRARTRSRSPPAAACRCGTDPWRARATSPSTMSPHVLRVSTAAWNAAVAALARRIADDERAVGHELLGRHRPPLLGRHHVDLRGGRLVGDGRASRLWIPPVTLLPRISTLLVLLTACWDARRDAGVCSAGASLQAARAIAAHNSRELHTDCSLIGENLSRMNAAGGAAADAKRGASAATCVPSWKGRNPREESRGSRVLRECPPPL